MRYFIPFCAAAFLVACSDSPTAPSPITTDPSPVVTQPPSTPGLTPSNLNWDRIGAGCPARSAPSPIPDGRPSTLQQHSDGTLTAAWAPYRSADGRDGLLSAEFVASDNAYVLCSWDMSDL